MNGSRACCVTALSTCRFTSSWNKTERLPTYPVLSPKMARSVLKAMRSLGTTSVRFLLSAVRTRAQASESEAGSFCVTQTFPAE